jgi:hypothetical protein
MKTLMGIAYCAFHNGDYKYTYLDIDIIGKLWTYTTN